MIMGRDIFTIPKTGPCGALRKDSIYPIGYITKFEDFKKTALEIVNKYYLSVYEGGQDICGIEFYEAEGNLEFRGGGKSIYLLIIDKDSNWNFYESDKHIFCVNKSKLEDIWNLKI